MPDFATTIVPSREADFLELARTKQGRLFRKHILNYGDLIHPKTGSKVPIDDDFVARLTKNFQDRVCDIVQVPVAGSGNEHTEDPLRNIGEVVGIEARGGKVYAVIDARDEAAADKLGKTLLGASAMMHLDYKDTRTGKPVGPTLLHVAVTNRPYVVELEDYEEIVAASADGSDDVVMCDNTAGPATLEAPASDEPDAAGPGEDEPYDAWHARMHELGIEHDDDSVHDDSAHDLEPDLRVTAAEQEITQMDLDALLAALKDEHGIDVPALQAQAKAAEGATELSSNLATALTASGVVTLSNGEQITNDDIVGAVAELATTNVALSNRLEVIEHERAEGQVDALVEQGYLLPAQRDTMVELRLTNEPLFEKLVPAEPVVALSREKGVTPEPKANGTQIEDIDAEIARYAGQAAAQGYVRG